MGVVQSVIAVPAVADVMGVARRCHVGKYFQGGKGVLLSLSSQRRISSNALAYCPYNSQYQSSHLFSVSATSLLRYIFPEIGQVVLITIPVSYIMQLKG